MRIGLRSLLPTLLMAMTVLVCAGLAPAAVITGLMRVDAVSPNDWQIVPGGFGEDVDAYVDRTHEWNSTASGPTIASLGLVGADYIMTANDDRDVPKDKVAYQVTFGSEATVYLLLDNRVNNGNPLPWMTDLGFVDSGLGNLGVDENGDGTGPGDSVDRTANILMVANLPAGTYDFYGQGQGGTNNYGIVAVPEPSSLLLLAAGAVVAIRRRR